MNENYSPLITTIIPYYDPPFDLFKNAIYSILSQSYTNWEAVVVNDGSSIESTKALRDFIDSLNEKRISVINLNKNCGVAAARNRGIEKANGNIITFLASDDLFLPWHYQEIVNGFFKYPEALILASCHVLYTSIFKIKRFFYNSSFEEMLYEKENEKNYSSNLEFVKKFTAQKLVFKSTVFKKIKYDESFLTLEDSDLIFQILSIEELYKNIRILPLTGHIYRFYPSRHRLSNKKALVLESIQQMLKKYSDKNVLNINFDHSLKPTSNFLKMNYLLKDYFHRDLILQFFKDNLTDSYPIKNKIKKLLSIIVNNFLISVFNIDSRQLGIFLSGGNGAWLKKIFYENIDKIENNKDIMLYVKRIYKEVF